MITPFMFATGIENSYPTIKNGAVRVDEMEKCGHYERWQEDFDLVHELGIGYLRYGPPIHRTWLGARALRLELRRRDLRRARQSWTARPIVDLCHFGVPDWIGNFQNPDFPALFASYARAFAAALPLGAALHAGQRDVHLRPVLGRLRLVERAAARATQAFVTALKHIVKANVLAMHAILDVRPDAIFIQSESSEYFHADNPPAIKPAELMNSRRFLSLDLNYGRRVDSEMYEYLLDNGMTRDEYHFFLDKSLQARTASWATTTTSPTSTSSPPTAPPAPRARSSATTRSPGSTTTATGCR